MSAELAVNVDIVVDVGLSSPFLLSVLQPTPMAESSEGLFEDITPSSIRELEEVICKVSSVS
jgi:hypothetical protein